MCVCVCVHCAYSNSIVTVAFREFVRVNYAMKIYSHTLYFELTLLKPVILQTQY